MRAGDRLIAPDGYEVALFPCAALYLTEARDPDEHDVYGLDFLPFNAEGERIVGMPCYAPFSGKIVYTGNDHNCILESNDLVHAPDGSLKYMRVMVAHSWNAPVKGNTYTQGDLFYTTGSFGQSTAEHLHMEVAVVDSKDVQLWNNGGIGIYGATHMWDLLYVDNTELLRPKDYAWVTYGMLPPPVYTRGDFIPIFNNISNTKRKEVNGWRL